jgi:hypothetical protein
LAVGGRTVVTAEPVTPTGWRELPDAGSGSHVGPLAAMPDGIRAGNLVETGMAGGAVLGERDRRTPAEIERDLCPSGPGLRRRFESGGRGEFASSYGSRRAPGTEGRWSEGVLRTTDPAIRPNLLALLGPLLMVIVSALQFWSGTACSAP